MRMPAEISHFLSGCDGGDGGSSDDEEDVGSVALSGRKNGEVSVERI